MNQVTISTDWGNFPSLITVRFALDYNLEPVKVQVELAKGLRDEFGSAARAIKVKQVERLTRYVYEVVYPEVPGFVDDSPIARALESLEGEVKKALRTRELIRMIKEN